MSRFRYQVCPACGSYSRRNEPCKVCAYSKAMASRVSNYDWASYNVNYTVPIMKPPESKSKPIVIEPHQSSPPKVEETPIDRTKLLVEVPLSDVKPEALYDAGYRWGQHVRSAELPEVKFCGFPDFILGVKDGYADALRAISERIAKKEDISDQ